MFLLATFGSVMSAVLYIFIAVLILMFMIMIHELGHFTAGKLLGFKINEFSIGMGPKLFSKKSKKDGQVFSLRAIPLGGYCAFEGEDEENPTSAAFNNQKPWKRIVVLLSGALMNFVSAVLIVIIAFSCFGFDAPKIMRVNQPVNAAETVALQEDDVILEVNGQKIHLAVEISKIIRNAPETSEVVVLRDGKRETLTVKKMTFYIYELDDEGKLVIDPDTNEPKLSVDKDTGLPLQYTGWGIGHGYTKINFTFGQALGRSVPYCLRTAGFVLETLGDFITGVIGIKDMGGPATTIDVTSQVVRSGIGNVLMLITLISVNLAVFNLLPLPALDGSRIVFVLIEWIFKKPVNRRIEGIIHFTGLILLFGFAILIDLLHYL